MNDQEAKSQSARLDRYNDMLNRRARLQSALDSITRKDASGPCGQGPFTGNTRESRRVSSMIIRFSKTLGGAAPAADMAIEGLELEAFDFGNYLQDHLNKKIAELDKVIAAI